MIIITFTVQIGSYALNKEAAAISADGTVTSGRPNPTRISWSKENIIKIHEIPWPKHKTCRTAKETLWKLDLEFVILTNSDAQEIQKLVDNVGPYDVKTAFKSISMYIQSFTANAEEGLDDYHLTCNMKLIERND